MKKAKGTRLKKAKAKKKGTSLKAKEKRSKKLKGHLTSLDAKHQLIKLKLATTYIINV